MPRPLMQSRIGDLEEMFAAAAAKPDVLRQLEHELQFRQVPRALTLLDKVQRAKVAASTVRPAEPVASAKAVALPAKQDVPTRRPATTAAQMSFLNPLAVTAQPEHRPLVSAPSSSAPPAQPPRQIPPAPVQIAPAMSLADACRLLNVAPGASWEAIEQARRAAVQKSSPLRKGFPEAHRGSALAAARLANAAYAALATARIAGWNH